MIDGNPYMGLTTPDGFRSTKRFAARTGRTQFITDDRGHLLNKTMATGTAFITPKTFHTNERWPVASTFVVGGSSHAVVGHGASATMGYKGVPSHYLPMGTVPVRTNTTCAGGYKQAHSHFVV